jgi:hypothetical protein
LYVDEAGYSINAVRYSGRCVACAAAIEARDRPAPVYTAASDSDFAASRSKEIEVVLQRACCLLEDKRYLKFCRSLRVSRVRIGLECGKLRSLRVKLMPKFAVREQSKVDVDITRPDL